MPKKISILGSTGSIGTNTLDIVRSHPQRFRVQALACGKNVELLKKQIEEFKPTCVSVQEEADAKQLRELIPDKNLKIVFGESGAIEVATQPESEMIVAAMVGASGLVPTLRAIEAKKQIALANKETMVIAGELMTRTAKKHGVHLLPVDSEHNAIFQVLQGHNRSEVKRLILTASGGPFLNTPADQLREVTREKALKHPNWRMGAKITIDSATLMNKGLEVIEARWLFDVPENQIDVIIHPQSVIHSMVEYDDGSVLAQLGIPDMRIPIGYALSYPERMTHDLPPLNLIQLQNLNFFAPDEVRFPCLNLARLALQKGGDAPCMLNAANEIAVQYFLEEKIGFMDIPFALAKVLEQNPISEANSLDHLLEKDRQIRNQAREILKGLMRRSTL